jgi:hypothetical protein
MKDWKDHLRSLGLLLLYATLTIVMTWPLAARLSSCLAGGSSDAYINPWANWWTLKALGEGLDFYHTDYIFYPRQVSLVFHSFSHVNTFLWFLLRPLGDPAAHNLTVMLGYTLSGWGMYCLARYLTGSTAAAFFAGLVFAFAPYHLAEGDHPVILSAQWLPLFALYFIQLLRAGKRRNALLAAIFFILNALTSWHLMVFAALWAGFYLAYSLLFERENLEHRWVAALICFVVVTVLVLAPFLYPLVREQLTTSDPFMAVTLKKGGKGNDLIAFFVPSMGHPVWNRFLKPLYDRLGYTSGSLKRPTAYLGYATLALAICGVIFRRRKARFWLLSGILFAALSLNTYLSIAGTVYDNVRMPWAEPVVGLLRHPYRFTLMLSFSTAALAGLGWLAVQERIARTRLAVLATLLTAIVLFESLVRPWPTTPLHVSPFYHQLAAEQGNFAVAAMPMGRSRAKESMYYQTLHGKRLVEGAVSRTPHNAYEFITGNPLLAQMYRGEPPDPIQTPPAEQMGYLADHNIRYIVLHKMRMTPDQIARWRAYLTVPPAYEDSLLMAYTTADERVSDCLLQTSRTNSKPRDSLCCQRKSSGE